MEQVADHQESFEGFGCHALFSKSISHLLSHLAEVNHLSHARDVFRHVDGVTGSQYYSAVRNAVTMSPL